MKTEEIRSEREQSERYIDQIEGRSKDEHVARAQIARAIWALAEVVAEVRDELLAARAAKVSGRKS